MSTFFYTAKSASGQKESGSLEAATEREVAQVLRRQGLFLTSIRSQKKKEGLRLGWLSLPFGRVSLVEKMMFTRNLSVMISAGLSLNIALRSLANQTANKKFQKIILTLEKDIREGKSFADSLQGYPNAFSEFYVNMVRVAELSGNLEEVLKVLAEQMQKDHQLISKIKGAMVYPAVILIAMISIGVLMLIILVPKLAALFEELEIELPLMTRIIIGLADFFVTYWIIVLVVLAVGIFLLRLLWRRSQDFKKAINWSFLHLPIIEDMTKKVNSARLARTLGSMIQSGVPIVKSLQVMSGVLTNWYFRQSLAAAIAKVQKGETLSSCLKEYPDLYPSMVTQMISVGEETGSLSDILEKLAAFYEEEVDNMSKNLSSIVEPVLMIIIGTAVGIFAVSMVQPMYSMMSGL